MLIKSNENNSVENQSNSNNKEGAVHHSRWGYYPYDYESYLKLKELNKIYSKVLKQSARWERWARKAPHNRVYRKYIRDEQGRKIGSRVAGPMTEPSICPVFTTDYSVGDCPWQLCMNGNGHRSGHYGAGYLVTSHEVAFAYRQSRTPVADLKEVPVPILTEAQINKLLEASGHWYRTVG